MIEDDAEQTVEREARVVAIEMMAAGQLDDAVAAASDR